MAPLLVLLSLWLTILCFAGAFRAGPDGAGFGSDFAMFVGAAQVTREGHNPYDYPLLFRTERALLQRQGLPILKERALVRVGNPPLFFWLLRPVTDLPFRNAARAWMLAMYALAVAGLLVLLRRFGWKRRIVPCVVFIMMPQVVVGAYYGNIDGLIFAAVAWGLALARRYPFIAGLVLCVAWLKPQVALTAVLLIALFYTHRRWRLIAGFTVATAGVLGMTLGTTGWHSLVFWLHGLFGYSRDAGVQPNLASLAGLYAGWSPTPLRLVIQGAAVLAAIYLTARIRHKVSTADDASSSLSVAWLWLVWFLVTPYAHFHDEILLTIPLLTLLGPNASRLGQRPSIVALYLMFCSLFLYPWAPFGVQFLWLPLLGVLVALVKAQNHQGYLVGSRLSWPKSGRPTTMPDFVDQ